jgi:protein associated with RNAse G/E
MTVSATSFKSEEVLFMEHVRLFRRRFLPDETTELKDDKILSISKNMLLTSWEVLKPRDDIASGISAYFIDLGIKVSKVFNADGQLVYWYCDIIEPQIDEEKGTYIFNDLLIDVLIYPDKQVKVVDLDEFADMIEKNVLEHSLSIEALRRTDYLLQLIYSGRFRELTDYIDNAEKMAVHA